MSYNRNYYNIRGNNFTFQNNFMPPFIPPPLRSSQFFVPQTNTQKISDQEFIQNIESHIHKEVKKTEPKCITISNVREKLKNLVLILNDLKEKEKMLSENIEKLSEDEWKSTKQDIERNKTAIDESMTQINDSYLDIIRKLLAKRSAKRLRLKRVRSERKKGKEDWIKEQKEKSRKIDEKLQEVKDDIKKAKQEQEAKLQADIVLKEVLRKKHDAKKCVVKLDALMKLRNARCNTAKGRGEVVSESDAEAFNSNIEKIKKLWIQKLTMYEKEECELRAKLKRDSETQNETYNVIERDLLENLAKWREFLFGDIVATPQINFNGNIERFVSIRSQWDQYVSEEGSTLPIGWVLP